MVRTAPVAPATKSGKLPETVSGWEELAALDSAVKAMSSLLDLRKSEMKSRLRETFIERGVQAGNKPDSMAIVEGDAKGSSYLTKRSDRSPLGSDDLKLIAETLGEDTVTRGEDGAITGINGVAETLESQPSMVVLNPAYVNDQALLKRIDKALEGVRGIPEDLIVQTPAEAKVVVSDTALATMFRSGEDAAQALLEVLGIVAVRPVYSAGLEKAWSIIKPLIPEAEVESKPKKKQAPGGGKVVLMRQLKASVNK
jgi:hypothetical protein